MALRWFPLRVLSLAVALSAWPASAHPTELASKSAERSAWWIFLADRGLGSVTDERAAVSRAESALTPRCRERRARVRGVVADLLDVPLHPPYVRAVLATGADERVRARWLNALSVDASPAELRAVAALPFVDAVRPVARAQRGPLDVRPYAPGSDGPPPGRTLDYGPSASQITPLQIDQLHDAGYSGAGVLICVTDTGFLLTHDCFAQIDVLDSWDFVNDDAIVENEAGDDPNQHNHGTSVLSALAGFAPGDLIGPAYGATFLLAKTEALDFELPVEEDYWIAAAQWADSLGADVISVSLSYTDWYTYADMDGGTAPITIAADVAAANGVTVVVSSGNYGNTAWHYIGAPADGDSVITVGSVNTFGELSGFSSRGPSFDGRTKPDVCAVGQGVVVALASDSTGYGTASGTSLSCPLTAGIAALLSEARPTWGPHQIAEAMRTTADQAATPNNDYGWGVVQGFDALNAATGAALPPPAAAGASLEVSPNPSARVSMIRWSLPAEPDGASTLAVHDVAGRCVRLLREDLGTREGAAGWDGRDEDGRRVATGIYFARIETPSRSISARVIRLR